MLMKEKMPLTSVTPVPAPSAATAAEAKREGPPTTEVDPPAEPAIARNNAPAVDLSHVPNVEDSSDEEIDPGREPKMSADKVSVFYGDKQALKDVSINIFDDLVTAFIGPSGCGKSTFLRCLNRMNDTIPTARVTGRIELDNEDITSSSMDVVQLRARVGMVFQKPNPFPKSIFENVAYGPRIHGLSTSKAQLEEIVERSLKRAGLWDEVKDRLAESGTALSGGQQQRLCIARAIAAEPEVLLLDEPCSALDPIATGRIEDLIEELKGSYSILIVTHNMQQASRTSDFTAFMYLGRLVEYGPTNDIFLAPQLRETEDYVTGRFG